MGFEYLCRCCNKFLPPRKMWCGEPPAYSAPLSVKVPDECGLPEQIQLCLKCYPKRSTLFEALRDRWIDELCEVDASAFPGGLTGKRKPPMIAVQSMERRNYGIPDEISNKVRAMK